MLYGTERLDYLEPDLGIKKGRADRAREKIKSFIE